MTRQPPFRSALIEVEAIEKQIEQWRIEMALTPQTKVIARLRLSRLITDATKKSVDLRLAAAKKI